MTLQRYVSEELTHFVGRGLSEEEQYSTLVNGILKTGWLKSDPKDPEPAEMLKTRRFKYRQNPLAPVENMFIPPVVCFCDIPISDLEIHMRKYSRFGLSFLKPFLIEKGANPVLYVANNSKSLPIGVIDTKEITGRRKVFQANAEQYVDLMMGLTRERPELKRLETFLHLYIFSFIKYFDDSTADEDPANVYMEREWRVLGSVNFERRAVRRVFLPEHFAERFRADLPGYTGQLTFSGGADS